MARKKAELAGSMVRAAYFAGPPEMIFLRRKWIRGAVQRVPDYEWGLMQARADFARHDFRIVPVDPEPDVEEKQS